MERISKHISWKEGTYSRTGERLNLDNTPNEKQLKCMKEVAENLFEPLREWVGGPIKINRRLRAVCCFINGCSICFISICFF